MDEEVNRWTDGYRMKGKLDGWMDGWLKELTGGQIDGKWIGDGVNRWTERWLVEGVNR